MARKRKAKAAKSKVKRVSDSDAIEAALTLAGVPAVDAQGRPIDTLAGRVIMALVRLGGPTPHPEFDPQDPAKVLAAAKVEQAKRDSALHPRVPAAPKKARRVRAKKARAAKPRRKK